MPPAVVVDTKGAELKVPGKLVYARGGNLWMLEEGVTRQLTTGGKDMQPQWSPDGSTLAYVKREQDYSEIMLMEVAGANYKQLTNNRITKSVWVFRPTWSPDGLWLAYERFDGTNLDIYILSLDQVRQGQAEAIRLTDAAGVDRSPAWSPRWLCFSRSACHRPRPRPGSSRPPVSGTGSAPAI